MCRWARNDALPSVMIDTTNQQTNPGDRYDEGDKMPLRRGIDDASEGDDTEGHLAKSGRLDDGSNDDTEGNLARSGRLDDGSDDDTEGNAARFKG